MPELDFASWTATIPTNLAGQRGISTTNAVTNWETEVIRDASLVSQSSDTQKKVTETGRYLVRYDLPFQQNPFIGGTPTRALVRSTLKLNSSELVEGRGSGYWRNAQACTRGAASSGAILDLTANDIIELFAQRIDTAGANPGATVRDSGKEGSISLWRLKDNWRVFKAKATADGSASTTSEQDLTWDEIEIVDTGWSGTVGGSTSEPEFDPSIASEFNEALFLVCVTVEAESSSASEAELELIVQFSDGEAASPAYIPIARITQYAEGTDTCRRIVCSYIGFFKGLENPLPMISPTFKVSYLHRNSNGVTFTPKADACSIQIVAIPPADVQYVEAVKFPGGEAADVDAAVTHDILVHEDPPFEFAPGGDLTKIRANGEGGMWAIVFANAYASPLGGARSANRLNHMLDLQVNGVRPVYGRGAAHNRGTNGCDRGGVNTHGIVKLPDGQDLQIFHDNTGNQIDANVDFDGGHITHVAAIRLRALRVVVDPPAGTVAVVGSPPGPIVTVQAPLGTVAIEGLAPSPRNVSNQALGTLVLEASAPAPRLRLLMPLAELVIFPLAPAARVRCNPDLGVVVLTADAPVPRVRSHVDLGELVMAPLAPAPRVRCNPELGTLALEPFSPTIQTGVRLDMPLGTLVLFGYPPTIFGPPVPLTNRKRLYDAMRARIEAAVFPWMQFDNLALVMIEGTNQAPSSAVMNEKSATFTPVPKVNRRHQFQETNIWAWELILQFNRQVSCELFERDLKMTPVTLPEDEGNGLEAVTFRFVSVNYEHPTEQQPSTGTKATYQLVAEVSPR